MRELTLFDLLNEPPPPPREADDAIIDHAASTTASAALATTAETASDSTHHTPIERLSRTVAAEAAVGMEQELHPREAKLWITRDGATYFLSVRRGKQVLRLSAGALRQLANLLDVSMSLLTRLSGLPRVEDCRLLNMLLWAEGAKPDLRYRVRIRGDEVISIHSGAFTNLDAGELARRLAQAEAAGHLRVRRYTTTPNGLWVELEHLGFQPIDLSPVGDRINSKADLWRPGAILWNEEDGGRAVTVYPVLFREWGGLVLPVVPSKSDLRKRRHAHIAQDALLRGAIGDLIATREAPFSDAAHKLMALHQRYLPNTGVQSFLDGLALPFPTKRSRDIVVRRVIAGRATVYRVITAALKEAQTIDVLAKRFRLEAAIGRYVWTGAPGRRQRRGRHEQPQESNARGIHHVGSGT